MASKPHGPGTSLTAYRAKRDFAVTGEPAPATGGDVSPDAIFVVQKHAAHRAGLHYDFRLEHGGVLWSWAVREGPSLDPADRRVAVHVEDHPIAYAGFQGTIPEGQYGGGTVETWDRGTWTALEDPDRGMQRGNLKFELFGQRLKGRFTLARLRRDPKKQEAWFLIKGHDDHARQGVHAQDIERETPLRAEKPTRRARPARAAAPSPSGAPAPGALRRPVPDAQPPQLCLLAAEPPDGDGWLSEIKFDGYRIVASIDRGKVRLLTRNGHDWADRMPSVAAAFRALPTKSAVLDGELVSLMPDGVSSFPGLQAALKEGRDHALNFYAFDLLHLDGWDLRGCALLERKRVLAALQCWSGPLRYSDHHVGDARAMHDGARRMKLEGIVCKRADGIYRPGRGADWLKVKCSGRDEFVVLGWTAPGGSRVGIGALQVGYRDPQGTLQYAGAVGTGFDDKMLMALHRRFPDMASPGPPDMMVAGDPVDPTTKWIRQEIVVEVQYTSWSGAGRVRHPVYLGLREDKAAAEIVRELADPDASRTPFRPGAAARVTTVRKGWHGAVPPLRPPPMNTAPVTGPLRSGSVVHARPPGKASFSVGGVRVTHPERELWPGVTKRMLAEYWQAAAPVALSGIAHRPLSILRCPEGIEEGKERFFQKNGHGVLPAAIRSGSASKQPFLAVDDIEGLLSLAQMSAIELHPWGAPEDDPLRPDWVVFDLDPGDGVPWPDVVEAARDTRTRLERIGLDSFCRTTGGKGLHVVVPFAADADWPVVKAFCKAFADRLAADEPTRFLAHLKIADRKGRILVDWLRNGLGATAVASYSPRARVGATVATPVAWREVTAKLDPAAFTVMTVPGRIAKLRADPWESFAGNVQRLPVPPANLSTRGSTVSVVDAALTRARRRP